MLTPEVQAEFVGEAPDIFVPVHRGWGRMGATHIRLAKASEDVLEGALRAAWKIRMLKNDKSKTKGRKGESSPKNNEDAIMPRGCSERVRVSIPAGIRKSHGKKYDLDYRQEFSRLELLRLWMELFGTDLAKRGGGEERV